MIILQKKIFKIYVCNLSEIKKSKNQINKSIEDLKLTTKRQEEHLHSMNSKFISENTIDTINRKIECISKLSYK